MGGIFMARSDWRFKRVAVNTHFLLLSMFAFAQVAYSETYRPFIFSDPQNNQRKDIRDKIKVLKVELTENSSASTARIASEDTDLFFFSNLADLLQSAAVPQPAIPSDAVQLLNQNCSAHTSFSLDDLLISTPACAATAQQLKQQFSSVASVCRYVFLPEQYVQTWPPGKVDGNTTKNLDGIISLAGEGLSHIALPGNILNGDLRAALRIILIKLRHQTLQDSIAQAEKAYAAALTMAARNPDCVYGTKMSSAVDALNVELAKSKKYLSLVENQGRALAERDRKAVVSQGRTRAELPYPSLSDAERRLFSFIVSGIYWRIRGNGLIAEPGETQLKRLYYTRSIMGFLGELNGGAFGKTVGESLHMPLVMKGWGDYFKMGRGRKGTDKFYDLVFMTDRGAFQVEGGIKLLKSQGYDASDFAAAGLQMGPCYYYSWQKLNSVFIGPELEFPYVRFLHGATSWGELCTGAALGLGLSHSLLAGYTP
jgi:hypothetical protein